MFDVNKEMNLGGRYGEAQNQPTDINYQLDNHFVFKIKRLPNTTFYCQSANLPGVNIGVVEQPIPFGFNTIKRPGGQLEHDDLRVQFIVDDKLSNWIEIFQWIKECCNYTDFSDYKSPQEHLSDEAMLFINSGNHKAVVKVQFYNVFPNAIEGLYFDTKSQSSQMISTVSFSFSHYELIDVVGG